MHPQLRPCTVQLFLDLQAFFTLTGDKTWSETLWLPRGNLGSTRLGRLDEVRIQENPSQDPPSGLIKWTRVLLCRLWEKYYKNKNMDAPDSVESVGHIQCYCPAHQFLHVNIHHGIWRELMSFIRKCSTKLNDEKEPRWHFHQILTLSPEARAEWGLTIPQLIRLKHTGCIKLGQ